VSVVDRAKKLLVLGAMGIFVFCSMLVLSASSSAPWHTAYVGIGAYPNDVGVDELADYEGYEFYEKVTGIEISTNAVNGNYGVLEERNKYLSVLKDRYFEVVMESPWVIVRNAVMNFFQVYSVGHIAGGGWINLVMTFVGGMVVVFLVVTKQYVWLVATGLSAIGFVFYFPPIPAYNFSSYLLLVSGFIFGIEKLRSR